MSKQYQLARQTGGQIVGLEESEFYAQQFKIIRALAPWAKDNVHDEEIGAVMRWSHAMGVNPLNPHEIQVWQQNGKLMFQLSYILMVGCVNRFQKPHTPPRYYHVSGANAPDHMGAEPDDHVCICEFYLREDLDRMVKMVDAGIFTPEEVREQFAYRGEGVVSAKDWERKDRYGNNSFAPNGRNRSFKLEKRALTDAYRRAFGDPTRAQIMSVREELGFNKLELEDFDQGNLDGIADDAAVALAKQKSQTRQGPQVIDTPEKQVDAAAALYGKPRVVSDEDVQDGEFTMDGDAPTEYESPLDTAFPRVPENMEYTHPEKGTKRLADIATPFLAMIRDSTAQGVSPELAAAAATVFDSRYRAEAQHLHATLTDEQLAAVGKCDPAGDALDAVVAWVNGARAYLKATEEK